MKFQIADGAAAALALIAIVARIVFGVAFQMPELFSGGWIAVLLGGLLSLPVAFALGQARKASDGAPVVGFLSDHGMGPELIPLCLILSVSALYDAAIVSRTLAGVTNHIEPNYTPRLYLIVPQLLLCLWALIMNGDALGSGARIWSRVLLALWVVTILLEFKQYRATWLTPVLGHGAESILSASVRVAGWNSQLIGLFLFSKRNDRTPDAFNPFKTLLAGTGVAALVVLTHGMMYPAMLGANLGSETIRLDVLLSNGRAPLSLQFPISIIWVVGLLLLLLYDAFLGASMLQAALGKLHRFIAIGIAIAAIGVLSMLKVSEAKTGLDVANWLYAVQAAVLAVTMLMIHRVQGGAQTHA